MKRTITTNILRRLALMTFLVMGFGVTSRAADYVFLYKNGNNYYFLYNNNGTASSLGYFSYSTCVWSGTSGSSFSNNGRYLYPNNGTVISANTANLTADNNYRISYTTGGWWSTTYYLRYNNGWTTSTNANNSGTQVVYTVTATNYVFTTPSITGGTDHFTAINTSSTYSHDVSSYTPTYYTLAGPSTYYAEDGVKPTTEAPTSTTSGITYAWTFIDGSTDNGYARIDNNGQVTYYNSYLADTYVTIKVTATHTDTGLTSSDTKTILFDCVLPKGNPVSITANDITLLKGTTSTASNYAVTAASGYAPHVYVSATSSATSVVSVTNDNGSFSLTGVTEGSATITVRAYNQDNTTVACSTTFTVTVIPTESVVTNSTVTIIDLEDHSWSYYSDASLPEQLHSLNPADVKITYFGNGTKNVSVTTNSTTPADNDWTSNATTVKVSSSETANTFIYYKTLERVDGSTSANPTGRCAYTMIPNPFAIRPSYTISGTKYYTGFYKWKVTKLINGSIYNSQTGGSSIGVGGTIDADQTVYFAPDKESGMEVELVALWARAYTTTGNGSMSTYVTGTNAYERNFHIVTSNNQTPSNYAKSYPVTISSLYPDGSSGGGSFKAGDFTANADTKIEYLSIGSSTSYTWNANGKNFVIGRGVTGTVNDLHGLADNGSTSFIFRIESGTFNNLSFMGDGYGLSSGVMRATMGCDYDRANNNDNSKLRVVTDIVLAHNATLGSQNNKGAEAFNCTVKSGNYDLGNYGGGNQFYISNWGNPVTYAKRTLTVEGGNFSDISGGCDDDGTTNVLMVDIRIKGGTMNSAVYGAAQRSEAQGHRRMIITGGLFKGWIAGGANGNDISSDTYNGKMTGNTYLYVGGNAEVNSSKSDAPNRIINRSIGGNVFGAGCGYDASHDIGYVIGTTNVVIADNAYVERGVYGGGSFGYATVASNIYILGGTVDGKSGGVTSAGTTYDSSVSGGVFGGACQNKGGTISYTIKGGVVNGGVFGGSNSSGTVAGPVTMDVSGGTIQGGLFGGGNGTTSNACNITGSTSISMSGGTIIGGVYGGGNTYSTIGQDATITINSGNIGLDAEHLGNIHGGGYGNLTRVLGSVTLSIGTVGKTGPTIFGDVYGGSAQGKTNGNSSLTSGKTTSVTFNSGTLNGNLYGGGLGNASYEADVYGPVAVEVNGGKITGAVFGCNNENGTPKNSVTVTINGTDPVASGYALDEVYGGGNKASYVPGNGITGYPTVEVIGCNNSIGTVYGGGNAANVPSTDVTIWGGTIGQVFGGGHGNKNANPQTEANVTGNVAVKIYGGTIGEVFAGSNSKGSINGNSCQVTIQNQGTCDMDITDVYGGGNEADGKAGTLNIGCGAVVSGNIYGGAKKAAISNNITLNITGGSLHNIFGGNNKGGVISGTITVNIDKDANCNTWHVDTVYGGGNIASYTAPNGTPNYPQVNIKNGTVSANVFGGGFGTAARVTGNPRVNITGGTIAGNVYGGGEAAPVTGSPVVTASGNNTSAAHLYGGGKGTTAVVTGSTQVNVSGGTYAYVFGGGEAADMSGSVTVNIQGGTITEDVYGGGALAHTNTANLNGNVVTPKTNTTTVNLTGGTIKNVYGGGLGDSGTEAKVYGDVLVNLNKGVAADAKGAAVTGRIFGCNNINGTPLGSATVYIYGTQNSGTGSMLAKNNDSYDIPAVYGGGNMAAYIPYADTASTHVIIKACRTASIDYVYGGGNAAPVPATDVKIYGSYIIGSLFGGGNGKDSIVVNNVKTPNPGADVGIYEVTTDVFNATDPGLRYSDPGNLKNGKKYILYGDTLGTSIIGTTHVTFFGGIVHHLFGGSNTLGDIIKKSNVVLGDEDLKSCDFKIDDVYGGSNEAYMSGSANIDMNCVDGMAEIYGGSKKADVSKNIVLTISGGKYGKVFGGNNISGRIFGSITVNIEQTGCLPIVIDELYGGGNEAPYSVYGYTGNTPNSGGTQLYDHPEINIVSCDTIHKIFGGGLGESAVVYGNPHVNINLVRGWTNGDYKGNNQGQNDPHYAYVLTKKISDNIGVIDTVFGGGNKAVVDGQTFVKIGTESTVTVHNVTKAVYNSIKNTVPNITDPGFTNGDGDAVTKNLTIKVQGANITGNVYGGGNKADVTGGTNVQIGPQ